MKARTTTILVIPCLIANAELCCDVSAGAGAGRVPPGGDDLPAGGHIEV